MPGWTLVDVVVPSSGSLINDWRRTEIGMVEFRTGDVGIKRWSRTRRMNSRLVQNVFLGVLLYGCCKNMFLADEKYEAMTKNKICS